jgi:hypothetical protein
MRAGFTPGAWVCLPDEADKDYLRIRGTQLGRRYKIADVHCVQYEGVHPREAEESAANARLIASAPDLLGELENCLDLLATCFSEAPADSCIGVAITKARAAIKKATEGTP